MRQLTYIGYASKYLQQLGRQFVERRSLARLLSTFLCCLAIVVHPVARLGGSYAFLVLPFQALVFGVQGSLAQQLELTVLNIMGAFLAIGFSTLAKYIASLTTYDSARSRATCAVFLVLISFFGKSSQNGSDGSSLADFERSAAGLIKSRLVRLTLSMRIALFLSIWLLTTNIGIPSVCEFVHKLNCASLKTQRVLIDSGNFLYVTLAPASLSLVALLLVMSFFRWSSSSFEDDMVGSFALLRRCLSVSLNSIAGKGKDSPIDHSEYLQLRNQLFQKSITLNETYSQAAFELRIGRLSCTPMRLLFLKYTHAS